MRVRVIGFIVWAGMSFMTGGFMLADLQSIGSPEFQDANYRSQLAASFLIGMMPPCWIVCPFMTGFYEHGWQIRRKR